MSLMSQTDLGPKSGSRHVCLVIAKTGPQGQVLYKGAKGVNNAAHWPEGSPAETGDLTASRLPSVPFGSSLWTKVRAKLPIFASASHQTGFDTRSVIKVGIKGMGRSGTNRSSKPADLCSSSTHLVQCESNEPSWFLGPNLGPGTDACL